MLDEADEMLNMGFKEDVERILQVRLQMCWAACGGGFAICFVIKLFFTDVAGGEF